MNPLDLINLVMATTSSNMTTPVCATGFVFEQKHFLRSFAEKNNVMNERPDIIWNMFLNKTVSTNIYDDVYPTDLFPMLGDNGLRLPTFLVYFHKKHEKEWKEQERYVGHTHARRFIDAHYLDYLWHQFLFCPQFSVPFFGTSIPIQEFVIYSHLANQSLFANENHFVTIGYLTWE